MNIFFQSFVSSAAERKRRLIFQKISKYNGLPQRSYWHENILQFAKNFPDCPSILNPFALSNDPMWRDCENSTYDTESPFKRNSKPRKIDGSDDYLISSSQLNLEKDEITPFHQKKTTTTRPRNMPELFRTITVPGGNRRKRKYNAWFTGPRY